MSDDLAKPMSIKERYFTASVLQTCLIIALLILTMSFLLSFSYHPIAEFFASRLGFGEDINEALGFLGGVDPV